MVRRRHHAVNTTVGPHITTIPSTPENRLGEFVSLCSLRIFKNYQITNVYKFSSRVHVSSGDELEVEMGHFFVILLSVILFSRIKRRGSLEIRAQEI